MTWRRVRPEDVAEGRLAVRIVREADQEKSQTGAILIRPIRRGLHMHAEHHIKEGPHTIRGAQLGGPHRVMACWGANLYPVQTLQQYPSSE